MKPVSKFGIVLAIAASCGACQQGSPVDESCTFALRNLAVELVEGERCNSVVRLDFSTLDPVGLNVVCGPVAPIDEAAARLVADTDTGFGAVGQQLAEADSGLYVFFEAPVDFGGVAVVSAMTGKTLFGGGIVWAGTGHVTYPTTWLGPDSFPSGCEASGALGVTVRYIDVPAEGGIASDAATLYNVVDAAWSTSLATALRGHGVLNGVTVLPYARRVGVFDPDVAEWLVIFDTGPDA